MPLRQVRVVAAEATLGQQNGQLRREAAWLARAGADDHRAEAGRQAHLPQFASDFRQPAIGVESAELAQQKTGFGKRRLGRRIEESQLRRIPDPEGRTVEEQSGQIRGQDFRWIESRKRVRLFRTPEADGRARPRPPGAAGPLRRGGARYRHGLQPRQAAGRLEHGPSRKAAVDDHRDAVDGDRGFGDGRGQNHLAAAGRRRADRHVLVGCLQRAVKRRQRDVRRNASFQPLAHPLDLALAGQEGEDTARHVAQRLPDDVGDGVLDTLRAVPVAVAYVHREAAAHGFDDRCLAQQRGDTRAVQRRRHDKDRKILPQGGLNVECERKSEIGVQGALVEFVEQHGGNTRKLGIGQDQPREDAFRHHLDAGGGGDPCIQPHPPADGFADRLAQKRGHAGCRGACGDAPGLDKDDAPGKVRLPDQVQRHHGRLAGAGRGYEHRASYRAQRRLDIRQNRLYGQLFLQDHRAARCSGTRSSSQSIQL